MLDFGDPNEAPTTQQLHNHTGLVIGSAVNMWEVNELFTKMNGDALVIVRGIYHWQCRHCPGADLNMLELP